MTREGARRRASRGHALTHRLRGAARAGTRAGCGAASPGWTVPRTGQRTRLSAATGNGSRHWHLIVVSMMSIDGGSVYGGQTNRDVNKCHIAASETRQRRKALTRSAGTPAKNASNSSTGAIAIAAAPSVPDVRTRKNARGVACHCAWIAASCVDQGQRMSDVNVSSAWHGNKSRHSRLD